MEYNTLYMDKLFLEEFSILSRRSYEYRENIQAEKFINSTVIPFVSDDDCSTKGKGGVINQEGEYISISATPQEKLMPTGYDNLETPIFYDETVIYLGYFIMQWGHFLVDFVPRLWWLKEKYKGEKIIVLTSNKKARISGNYLELLGLFGINEKNIHYVYRPEKYSNIIIPEMSMIRPKYFSKQAEELYEYIVEKAVEIKPIKIYEKIYFSRLKLKKSAMTEIGEKDFERIYRKNGYKVIYPEKCSFKELVYYINNCKEFVSLSGTIPHNIVFAKPNTKVIIINKTYRVNTIQLMLNSFKGISPIYIDSNISMFPSSPGSGPFWMEIEENFIKYSKDNNIKIPKIITTSNFIVEYYRRQRRANRLKKYILMYVRLRDKNLDIGGSIIGSARPDEGFDDKKIYYFYREKVKEINSNTNMISLLTNIYHYFKGNTL